MRGSFHAAFGGFRSRYALRDFRRLRGFRLPAFVLCWVLCCLGEGSVASAQVPTWTSNGPEGGSIATLAIDPVTPTTLYAGTGFGGVFKSSDGGGNWSAINDGLTNTNVQALAIDPTTSTPYAGTGGGGVFVFQ